MTQDKLKPVTAFAAWHRDIGINPYWVCAQAQMIRKQPEGHRSWNDMRKEGWRIVKVKISADGRPR